MGEEPLNLHAGHIKPDGEGRELVSGEEIQRRVQAMIDADPRLRDCDKKVLAPMPKPTASESPTGCNWTMHYLGQFPGCEPVIDEIVELVQHEVNIGRSARL
ncbi:hypothetical protein ASE00_13160 [Sphingomonas sp. Root710]|uniref:hypothetical protein n=1 Tax=Sphingomonas sp. Root710 TaxID=1736594 RepID=UPI0006FE8C61|nr:hypothetical protein [Sphingomonas sp. Root710]KRB82937.1 hypothetical protein ASE00_13160 [Sphingomonas sp. Root710]